MRDIILEQKEMGKTIFISSHILSEVEKVCDEIGIINEGRLITKGNMDRIKRIVTNGLELEVELDKVTDKIVNSLKCFDFIDGIEVERNVLKIKTLGDTDHRKKISESIFREGGTILGMKENKLDLEGAFVEITKGNVGLLK